MKKLWNWFNGKKTNIGSTIVSLASVAVLIFPEHTTAYKIGLGIGLTAQALGIGHKIEKGEIKLPTGKRE